jgi:hypothetical protein
MWHGFPFDALLFLLYGLVKEEFMVPPKQETEALIRTAVLRARSLHTGNDRLFEALLEEVGEIARARLEQGVCSEDAKRECYDAIAVLVRLIEEEVDT